MSEKKLLIFFPIKSIDTLYFLGYEIEAKNKGGDRRFYSID